MNAASVTMTHTTMELPVSKRFFPGLLPIIGVDTYERVIARYGELYSNQGLSANPQLRWHLVEGILPGLALYQVLRENGESQDNALGRIDRAFDQLFSGDIKQMKRIGHLSFALLFFRAFLKSFRRKYPPEGWTIEWKQNSRDGIRFDMTTCFHHATLSNLGAPELTAAFCRVDDLNGGDRRTEGTGSGSKKAGLRWVRLRHVLRSGRGERRQTSTTDLNAPVRLPLEIALTGVAR